VVVPDTAPSVRITRPADGATLEVGDPAFVIATATDDYTPVRYLEATLQLDGETVATVVPDSLGQVFAYLDDDLLDGDQSRSLVLSVIVRDELGQEGADEATICVHDGTGCEQVEEE